MAKLTFTSELALERAIVRLQTISKLSDVIGVIAPIIGIVKKTKVQVSRLIPSVANKLDMVTSMLNYSMEEMGSVYASSGSRTSEKATNKILSEANTAAEEKIREKFPKLPKELHTSNASQKRIPIAITASGGELSIPETPTLKLNVYDYIKNKNGKLSVTQCASHLGVYPTDVEQAILQLKAEGKIAI
jgi:hypothetical protein